MSMDISVELAISGMILSSLLVALMVHYYHTKDTGYLTPKPYQPAKYDPSGDSALPAAVRESQRTLNQALQVHSEQTKKAIQMAQINGIIITALIAIISNFDFSDLLNSLLSIGGVLFAVSTVLAVFGTRGQSMTIGIGTQDFDSLIEYDLDNDQYNLWMLNEGYRSWIEEGRKKVARKRNYVRWSILIFLVGLLIVMTGFFISFSPIT